MMKDVIDELAEEIELWPIAANADKLLADVPYYQDCDIVIGLHNDESPFVKVVQRYVPEEIVLWYKENN